MTKEQADNIVENSDAFYKRELIVDNFKVVIYNYRFTTYSDFEEHNAFELRGLTFVYNPQTKEWEKHLALKKFFNINETPITAEKELLKKEIVDITVKEDGSLITFIKFPNGKVKAKTQNTFESQQAIEAQNIFEKNQAFRESFFSYIEKGYTPIYEFVSPTNTVVIPYQNPELRLIQLRDPQGKFVNLAHNNRDANKTLSELLELKKTVQDIEGWVVKFSDNTLVKIKTDHYLSLHGLLTDTITNDNMLVKALLDGKLDDLRSHLTGEKLLYVLNFYEKLMKIYHSLSADYDKLSKDFSGDKKEFALKYSKNGSNPHPLFPWLIVQNKDIKEYILSQCKTLEKTKKFMSEF